MTPPADAVARLTKLADDYASRGDFATEDDLRTLLAAYADVARDRERMDYMEQSGLVLSCQDSEQEDGSDVAVWMLGPDLDASNALWVGPNARAVLDAARTGEAR